METLITPIKRNLINEHKDENKISPLSPLPEDWDVVRLGGDDKLNLMGVERIMSRKRKYKYLLEKAILAAIAAVDAYNKPIFPYKQEAFVILMTNAWELLLKAKWIHNHGNDIRSIFVKQKNRRYKRNRAGNIMTYDLTYLLNQMKNAGEIPLNVYNNLIALLEIRDNAVHLYVSSHLREQIYNVALAASRNFYLLTKKWFNNQSIKQLESIVIQPVHFIPQEIVSFTGLRSEERLYYFLRRLSETQEDDREGFLVTAEVRLKFVRSKRREGALPVRVSQNDPSALPVELTEEQWRERFPWDYKELTKRLRNRYENFKQNKEFYELKKKIELDPSQCRPEACFNRYCRIRFLDTTRPDKSPLKKFYSPSVIEYFDQFYTGRET